MKIGKFIVIEGPDKSGKSTLCQSVYDYINSTRNCILVKDPGSTEVSDKIREILRTTPIDDDLCMFLLFSASRSDMVASKIIPALYEGKIVISDRFCLSSIIYQGLMHGISLDVINYINNLTTRNISPDLQIILDIDNNYQPGLDECDKKFYGNRANKLYKTAYEYAVANTHHVNADASKLEVFHEAKYHIDKLLGDDNEVKRNT